MAHNIELIELMGEHVKNKLKFCGQNVVLYPLCKIIRAEHMEIGAGSRICDFAYIDAGTFCKIGEYCMITWHTVIEGGASIIIGDRCFVGPGTKLLTSTYNLDGYFGNEFLPKGTQEILYGDIYIGDDGYIGANCTVMPGVKIGTGAVVGANSFVNKDLEPWGIYVGCPCKKIGTRTQPSLEKQLLIRQLD